MEPRTAHVLESLRARWGQRNILNQGASGSDIAAFERRYGVALPADVRSYFALLNGTHAGAFGMEDEHLLGFWHLDQVRTFQEEGVTGERADRCFVIADHSIWAHAFAVQLGGDPTAASTVVTDVGRPRFRLVAPSLTMFLAHYLDGNKDVLYPDPSAQATV